MASRFTAKLGGATHHKDKECVKVHFEIVVKTAENVPTTGNVYVQWKRGKKNENKGESKHVPVKDKKAVFEELLEISSTLYKIPKKGYESKNISITLKEEKGKKGSSIAKTVIDLAEFAGKDEKRSFSLKSKKSKVAPTLTLHFKSKERELAPDEEITETDNVTEETVSDDEDEAEDFTEDSRDDSSSKSGKSSASSTPSRPASTILSTPEKSKERDLRRDSVSSINALDVEQLRAELAQAKKRTKELATENVDFEDKVKELTKELEEARNSTSTSEKEAELRRKVKELTQENSDKDEQIKKLRKEQEEASNNSNKLSASSGTPSEKEAQMKKRLKELATENVDLEEQITALKKQLDEVKAQGGKQRPDKEDALQRQVQELTDSMKEKDNAIVAQKQEVETLKKSNFEAIKEKDKMIASQKQELENLRKSGGDTKLAEKELNDRIKEKDSTILSLKQELEKLTKSNADAVKERDSTILSLKQEVHGLKESSGEKDELRKRIKELNRANEDTEEEVQALKAQVEQLKKAPQASVAVSTPSEDTKRLQRELAEKDEKISELEREVNLLKRKSNDADLIQEYKDKVDNYKAKLKTVQEESDRKLEQASDLESELRNKIRDLEDDRDHSARSANKGQDKEREKYERDLEKEKESRKKAEKEAMKLREKLEELEDTVRSNGNHAPNGKDGTSSSLESDRQKKVLSAVYSHIGQYSSEDGVSESALAVWAVLLDTRAYLDDNDEHRSTIDNVISVLKTACNSMPNDMNMLFYWLSTTCALLHMLRDESDAHSNNDRDPIIDGVYQPTKEPSPSSPLQDRLEWLAFSVYKQLVSVICDKLMPELAPVIIEKPLTDKNRTQVKTSAVMRILDRVLARTRNHYLYDAVTQQLFVQLFYAIDAHLVNIVLQKTKLTPSSGFQIKLGLSHLEDWISQPESNPGERALLAPCVGQLDGLRDVGGVLVLDKALLADASTLQSIFKALNLRQVKRLLEVFEPDQLAQGELPSSVRHAIQTTWNNPQAASLPLLFDPSKIIAFSPQFD
jgi:hypothetical protein